MEYVIWFVSILLFTVGWAFCKFFYRQLKKYFFPYLLFQLGITLFVASIFLIGGWEGMAWGMMSLLLMGMGLLAAIFIYCYQLLKKVFVQS